MQSWGAAYSSPSGTPQNPAGEEPVQDEEMRPRENGLPKAKTEKNSVSVDWRWSWSSAQKRTSPAQTPQSPLDHQTVLSLGVSSWRSWPSSAWSCSHLTWSSPGAKLALMLTGNARPSTLSMAANTLQTHADPPDTCQTRTPRPGRWFWGHLTTQLGSACPKSRPAFPLTKPSICKPQGFQEIATPRL